MKDQYFGDSRDYFKYQLLEALVSEISGVDKLVCLWMLTPPDTSGEGNVEFAENESLPDLTAFLRRHLSAGDRRVRHLREYFHQRGITYVPWGDEPPYFSGTGRQKYFTSIPAPHLGNSLVFFDPDIGLAHGRPTSKHLSFGELKAVYERMSEQSVAVVYQHRWRTRDFWNTRALEIMERLGASVRFVADSSVGYFVVPKEESQLPAIDRELKTVAATSSSRMVGATG